MSDVRAGFRFTVPGRQISRDMGRTWYEPVYRVNQIRKGSVYYGPEDETTSSFTQEKSHFEWDLTQGRKVPME